MVDPSGGDVNFLTLAYLLEFALVLNLTYRELKFPELYDQLKDKVEEIYLKHTKKITLKEMGKRDLDLIDEVHLLHQLLNPEQKIDTDKQPYDVWSKHPKEKVFFQNYIKKRCSLTFVNWHIIISLSIVTICTILSNNAYLHWIEEILSPNITNPVAKFVISKQFVWHFFFIFSIYLCIVPLIFIRRGTACEIFFYGTDKKSGIVQTLESNIIKKYHSLNGTLESEQNDADSFSAGGIVNGEESD